MNNTPTPYTPTTPAPSAPKPAYAYTTFDFALALILWVMGYLFWAVTPVMDHPLLAFGFEVLLFVGGMILLTRQSIGGILSARAIAIVAVSLMLALSLLLTTNRAIVNCVFLWNCMAWFYLVFVMTRNSKETIPGGYFIGELLTATFLMPFRSPGHLFGAIFGAKVNADGSPRTRSRVSASVGWVLLGLCVAVIPTVIVGLLLSYDAGFSSIMNRILDEVFSAEEIFRQLRNIGLGLLVGALLFGAVLAGKHKKSQKSAPTFETALDASASAAKGDGAHVLPVALIAAALTPLLILYVIFFMSQWDYYVSAFTGVLPEELTYATYAREGFFQLLAVTVINAVAGIAATCLSVRRPLDGDHPRRNRTHPIVRVYMVVLSLFTLVLIATALSKMLLYVDTYGMTHKRTYATWLMLLLAVAFIATLIRQIWGRMNLTGTLLAVFLVFLLAISVVNVDNLIMQYNVDTALDGNIRTMQGDVVEDCGYSGVIPALRFMEESVGSTRIPMDADAFTEDELLRTRASINSYLHRAANELEDMEWYRHNIVTLRAKIALEKAGYGS